MFRRLTADGLVGHAEGRDLHLTPAGRAAADGIFRRHALLEWLLTSVIGLGWAESDDEAMRLQGAISPRVEARLDEMLGHPETCPHGNPIDAETARRRPAGTALSEMEAGQPATIYRITEEAEEDAGLLSYLEARALTPGRPRHDPRAQRIARLADPGRTARPRDARPPAGRARAGAPGRGGSGALPPRPGTRPARRMTAPRGPDRPEPDRTAPHRHGPDGPVQLPPRPAHRRDVHPAPRGHRPGARLDRLREGHPRRPALAGPALGRGPGGGRRGGPRARSRRTARCSACRSTRRRPTGCWPPTRRTRATARRRSSTPIGRPRRRPRQPPRYVGRCAALTAEERAARVAEGRHGALRFRVGTGIVAFDDIVRGRVEFDVVEPRWRLRDRPGRRHAALQLHRGGRRRGDGDQRGHPRRGPPLEHPQADPDVPGARPSRARGSPTCRSSSIRTGPR